ncbi:PREDICTED: uncharacterized protein LOC107357784 [Acropora digitifera]|uniref:uncharacterized protein LOC107357784 n=1 Tax=Acropora digitifera TaxID=70779 RepID=UPI00077AFBA5|nr:PREDICTED: uncharacterized protein LOC107357784 [Acropora digitifera]
MFPTAGYFRSTNCPFFVHGLCHRPYCHFRHCKPGVKTSKSKPSPHKNKTAGHHDVSKRKEIKECTSEGPSESDNKLAVSEAKKVENHSSCDENKHETKTTEIKGILKRQTDKGNEGSISEDSANSLATKSVESKSLEANEKNTEEFESDDTDQPIASLTEEEKQIIGLFSHTVCGSDGLCEDKSSDVRCTTSVEDACDDDSSVNRNATLIKDANVSSVNTSVSTNVTGIDDCDDVTSRDKSEQDIKPEPVEVNCCASPDNNTIYSEAQESMIEELKTTSGQGDMSQTNDELSNSEERDKLFFPKRRKSIQLKTPLIDSSAKKRKSQQLLCVSDPSSVKPGLKSEKESNKFDKILGNEDAVKCKSTLNQFLESKPKLWEKVKNMSTEEADSVNEEGLFSSPPKKLKLDQSDGSPLKKKSPLKDLSAKKKPNLAEAEINFFDSPKKTSKGRKLEKSNNKEKRLSVRTTKVINHEPKGKDFKRKFAKGVTILMSDESDTLSPANCQSSSEEESHLKRIWDDFEPKIDIPEYEPEPLPTRKTQAVDSTARKVLQTTVPGAQPVDVKKQSSVVNTLGLGKKQRVAHTANHLPRRTSSNANPVRRYPKTLAATIKKDVPTTSSSTVEPAVNSSLSFKPVKQRVAHVTKTSVAAGSLPRPRIPVEYGAKVPQNQRQRYLDRIIDEYLRLCSTQKEAFEKAVEEETALYERSTRRQVYLNLCVNAIKKLRDMTPQDMAASLPAKAETEKKLTKTLLPSGAVVISSKSPVKQTQPTSPNSADLTEEVMYDFLLKYLMTEDDLVQNGFPRPCPSLSGQVMEAVWASGQGTALEIGRS